MRNTSPALSTIFSQFCLTRCLILEPRAGQKVFTVQGAMPRDAARAQALCADEQGFSLHAAVRCGADERQRLEQLCRTITRPALANERVQINSAGQVVVRLKTPWRDDTTHIAHVAAGAHAALGGTGDRRAPFRRPCHGPGCT